MSHSYSLKEIINDHAVAVSEFRRAFETRKCAFAGDTRLKKMDGNEIIFRPFPFGFMLQDDVYVKVAANRYIINDSTSLSRQWANNVCFSSDIRWLAETYGIEFEDLKRAIFSESDLTLSNGVKVRINTYSSFEITNAQGKKTKYSLKDGSLYSSRDKYFPELVIHGGD